AVVVGFAVCLLNPHLWRVFQPPAQLALSPAAEVLGQDPIGRALRISPLRKDFYRAWLDYGPGLAAAALLAGLGLYSFFLQRRALVSWRFALWLALLLLGLYQARALGFFAVAAGLLACANLLEARHSEEAGDPGWRPEARALVLGGLLL